MAIRVKYSVVKTINDVQCIFPGFGDYELCKRMCRCVGVRPERPTAYSLGRRPGSWGYTSSPWRGNSHVVLAFALTGRLFCIPFSDGLLSRRDVPALKPQCGFWIEGEGNNPKRVLLICLCVASLSGRISQMLIITALRLRLVRCFFETLLHLGIARTSSALLLTSATLFISHPFGVIYRSPPYCEL